MPSNIACVCFLCVNMWVRVASDQDEVTEWVSDFARRSTQRVEWLKLLYLSDWECLNKAFNRWTNHPYKEAVSNWVKMDRRQWLKTQCMSNCEWMSATYGLEWFKFQCMSNWKCLNVAFSRWTEHLYSNWVTLVYVNGCSCRATWSGSGSRCATFPEWRSWTDPSATGLTSGLPASTRLTSG